jgi:hypothetical protein
MRAERLREEIVMVNFMIMYQCPVKGGGYEKIRQRVCWQRRETKSMGFCEISSSHDDEYEDDSLLGCCRGWSCKNWLKFQRYLLPPSSGRWMYVEEAPRQFLPCHATHRRRRTAILVALFLW